MAISRSKIPGSTIGQAARLVIHHGFTLPQGVNTSSTKEETKRWSPHYHCFVAYIIEMLGTMWKAIRTIIVAIVSAGPLSICSLTVVVASSSRHESDCLNPFGIWPLGSTIRDFAASRNVNARLSERTRPAGLDSAGLVWLRAARMLRKPMKRGVSSALAFVPWNQPAPVARIHRVLYGGPLALHGSCIPFPSTQEAEETVIGTGVHDKMPPFGTRCLNWPQSTVMELYRKQSTGCFFTHPDIPLTCINRKSAVKNTLLAARSWSTKEHADLVG